MTDINAILQQSKLITRSINDKVGGLANYKTDGNYTTETQTAIRDTDTLLTNIKNGVQITPSTSTSVFTYGSTIGAALNAATEVENKLAEDPTWNGSKSASALHEEEQLRLLTEQNETMTSLFELVKNFLNETNNQSSAINTIATAQNTEVNLLNEMVNGQKLQTNSLDNILGKFDLMQKSLNTLENSIESLNNILIKNNID